MVDTLTLVLAGILVYTVVAMALNYRGALPEGIRVNGPITTLRTQRGKVFLDRLAAPRRFWRAWSNFGLGVALVVMGSAFVFLLFAGISSVRNPPEPTAVNQPRNVLVIPGVNDFLPLSAAPEIVAGLVVGLVVHEGGHGLLCRVEDIEIDSMGLAFFAFIPVGAFVEPDEASRARASRGGQTRMFAAGVTNNFAVTIVVFALLFGPVIASIGVAPGAAVGGALPNSSAEEAGIGPGDRITAVDGRTVENNSALNDRLRAAGDRTVRVEVNGERTVTVDRSVQVIASIPDSRADFPEGATVTSVNGTAVHTESAFRAAVENETRENDRVRVTARAGDRRVERTFVAGAYVLVAEDGPLAEGTDLDPGQSMVIVRIEGAGVPADAERVYDGEGLREALADTEPGETLSVTGYVNGTGERRTVEVTLAADENDGGGFLGILAPAGVTGLLVDDFGIRTYPADTYLTALGKGGGGGGSGGAFGGLVDSFFGKMIVALYLPIGGVLGTFPFNFAGFTGFNTGFYVATGPLGFLGEGVFLLANLLFWIGWINVQLGFFNCIPAFPLDGGHMLRTSAEAVVSRLPVEASRGMIRVVTTTVGVTMLLSFLLLVFGPTLLG